MKKLAHYPVAFLVILCLTFNASYAQNVEFSKTLDDFTLQEDSVCVEFALKLVNRTGVTLDSLRFFDESPVVIHNPEVTIEDDSAPNSLVQFDGFDGLNEFRIFTGASGNLTTIADGDSIVFTIEGKLAIDDFAGLMSPVINIGRFRSTDLNSFDIYRARSEMPINIDIIRTSKFTEDASIQDDSLFFRFVIDVENKGTTVLDSLRLNDPLPFPATIKDVTINVQADNGLLMINSGYDGVSDVRLIDPTSGNLDSLGLGNKFQVILDVKTPIDTFVSLAKPIINIARGISVVNEENLDDFARDTLKIAAYTADHNLDGFTRNQDSVCVTFSTIVVNKGTEDLDSIRLRVDVDTDHRIQDIDIKTDQTSGTLEPNPTAVNGNNVNLIRRSSANGSLLACGDSIVVCYTVKLPISDLPGLEGEVSTLNVRADDPDGNLVVVNDDAPFDIRLLDISKTMDPATIVFMDSLNITWDILVTNIGSVDVDSLRLNDNLPFPARIISITETDPPTMGNLMGNPNFNVDGIRALITGASGNASTLDIGDSYTIELRVRVALTDLVATPKPVQNIANAIYIHESVRFPHITRDTVRVGAVKATKELLDFMVMEDSVMLNFEFNMINFGTDSLDRLRLRDTLPFIEPFRIKRLEVTLDQSTNPVSENNDFNGKDIKGLITNGSGNATKLGCGDTVQVQLDLNIGLDDLVDLAMMGLIENEFDAIGRRSSTMTNVRDEAIIPIQLPIIQIDKELIDDEVIGDSIRLEWMLTVENRGTETLDSLRLNDRLPFPARIIEIDIPTQPDMGMLLENPNYNGDMDRRVILPSSGYTASLNIGSFYEVTLEVMTSKEDFFAAGKVIQNISRAISTYDSTQVEDFDRDTLVIPLIQSQKEFLSSELNDARDSVFMCFNLKMINVGIVDLTRLRIRDGFPWPVRLDSSSIIYEPMSCNIEVNEMFDGQGAGNFVMSIAGSNMCILPCRDSIEIKIRVGAAVADIGDVNMEVDNILNSLGEPVDDIGNVINGRTVLPFIPFEYMPDIAVTKSFTGFEELMNGNVRLLFEFEIKNTGNTDLDSLNLMDSFMDYADVNAGMGPENPMINIVSNSNTPPMINMSYDGVSDISLFDGMSVELSPGDSLIASLDIEVDPDSFNRITKPDPLPPTNSAVATAQPKGIDDLPIINSTTGDNYQVGELSDLSDDGTGLENNGDPATTNEEAEGATPGADDDPTPVNICDRGCEEILLPQRINYSLGSECESIIMASDLSDSVRTYCDCYYTLELFDKHLNPVPDNLVDASFIGKVLKFSIQEQGCPQAAWGEILIEDKMPPMIECEEEIIMSCLEFAGEPIAPEYEDNCEEDTIILLLQIPIPMDECDEEYIAEYERVWVAYDTYGNTDTCRQTILLERINLMDVMPPPHLLAANMEALDCNSGFDVDEEGNPDPIKTSGSPFLIIDGEEVPLLSPDFAEEVACMINVSYTDKKLPGTCVQKIMRTFHIFEWCVDEFNEIELFQMIEIADTMPPSILQPIADDFVSTGLHDCSSTYRLPEWKKGVDFEDICQDSVKVLVQIDGERTVENGALVQLDEGVHEIIYVVQDKCWNTAYDTFTVTVTDGRAPQAICIQETTVQLDDEGVAIIYASSLNNRSFDQCSEELSMQARRKDGGCGSDPMVWGDMVSFCCEDAGKQVMVELQLTDDMDNQSICWVTVNVDYKPFNLATCPADMDGQCGVDYDLENLTKDFGGPVFDSCPGTIEMDEEVEDNRDQCGFGNIVRTFIISGPDDIILQECVQTITIGGMTGIDPEMIDWPEDFDTTGTCVSVEDLEPENLPDSLGQVILPDGFCTMTSIKKDDTIFSGILDHFDACYKIERTWKVLDWCDQRNGRFALFTHKQIIKVRNEGDPVITSSCRETLVESIGLDCDNLWIELTIDAEDDCTPTEELRYKYIIDIDDDGDSEIMGDSVVAKEEVPIGTHRIFWEVSDGCGNSITCDYAFEVRNIKAPTPKCQGASLPLAEVFLDGDNIPDTLLAILTPDMIDLGSAHNCGYDISLSFSEDIEDDTLMFGCDQVGMDIPVELWVTDEFGNQSFCGTFVTVTLDDDPNNICDGGSPMAAVSGEVSTSTDETLEGVEIRLIGSELPILVTTSSGEYAFSDMPIGGNYEVIPYKNNDVLNGVSTLDLLLIQRHILGIKEFTDLHHYIAADVDNNKRLTAADILVLRKVILGIYADFPDNTSWRFIDRNYPFISKDYLTESWPEKYIIHSLVGDMLVDFVGVKIGDVNNDGIANRQGHVRTRSFESMALILEDRWVEKGEVIQVPIYHNKERLGGIQLSLEMDKGEVVQLLSVQISIDKSEYIFRDSRVDISKVWTETQNFNPDLPLFSMQIKAERSGQLSEMITLNSDGMKNEGYSEDGSRIYHPKLEWRHQNGLDFDLLQNNPNPWRNQTVIPFTLPESGITEIQVRDMLGRTLYYKQNHYQAGHHRLMLRDEDIHQSGVLIIELVQGSKVLTKRMIHIE